MMKKFLYLPGLLAIDELFNFIGGKETRSKS